MKTLENHTLLYDMDCPLCKAYTSGFIRSKMLDSNGRKPFADISSQENYIDLERASNEIALIDTKNKTVIYGVDSLLKVIGNSFPIISTIGQLKPIKFLLKKCYSFISYNRKVIVPNKINKEELNCVPTFNLTYRLAYIVFATLITMVVLSEYSDILSLFPKSNIYRELLLAIGQILLQSLFLLRLDRQTAVNYIGNLMSVSLMGSLLLIPTLVLNQIILMNQIVVLGWFGMVVSLMFLEHFRRVKLLELSTHLSYTWVLYRIMALIIILNQ